MFTGLMAALLLMEKRSVMMACGRALFTHLIIVCHLNLVIDQNLLGDVKIAQNLLLDFMIVQRCRATHLVYYALNVLTV